MANVLSTKCIATSLLIIQMKLRG